jgi:hypothetical protein
MANCLQCGKSLEEEKKHGIIASISGSIMGDEMTETFFFCAACQVYSLEICHDRFCGETSVRMSGPLTKAEGDARVEIIRACSEPWDKKCRCEAHKTYFEGWLD